MSQTTTLITAEEYGLMPDNGRPTELIRGRVHMMNLPFPLHGRICVRISRLLDTFAEEHDLGHVLGNDSGIITERDPDTVRGADVAFYSFERVPKGTLGTEYLPVAPEVVFEVRSPSDSWSSIHRKIGEYLEAGVLVVCVADPDTETMHVHYADRPARAYRGDETLELPPPLQNFREPVKHFFVR